MGRKRTKKTEENNLEVRYQFSYPCQLCKGHKTPFNIDYQVKIFHHLDGTHSVQDTTPLSLPGMILGVITCPFCGQNFQLIHRSDFSHELKRA